MSFDVNFARKQFPALALTDNAVDRIYLDNPAGTQVPQLVIDRMSQCLIGQNANLGGYFETSLRAGSVVDDAHQAMADLLNARSVDEIIFGQNMTSLTLHVSRSIGRLIKPGDEILLSRMDHDANVQPWILMANDVGATIKWIPFNTERYEFDLETVQQCFSDKTRLVCIGGASNLLGTINDVKSVCSMAAQVGALSYIDAVQSVPHIVTDVQDINCDFLACSAYKFFGPHQGILYGKQEKLAQLMPYKVRPASEQAPGSFEPGTQSHEGMAGTAAAVEYLASLASTDVSENVSRGERVHTAMNRLFEYETKLAKHLIGGLQAISGITVRGVSDPTAMHRRVPTVSFTSARYKPTEIAQKLAERNIFVWSGHNYAVEVVEALGLREHGVVRVGPVHYNTVAELDQLLQSVEDLH